MNKTTAIENKKILSKIKVLDDVFVLIEASKLREDDEFLQHCPRNENEREFKELLVKVIKKGVKDFWKPIYDPSFTEEGGIRFVKDAKVATGKSYAYWEFFARKHNARYRSRLGKRSEYIAFLGVFMKMLYENGWEISKVWSTVCKASNEVGHYWNSKDTNHEIECTGSREILVFCDLGNVCKIVSDDDDTFGGLWIVGGNYKYISDCCPLVSMAHTYCDHSGGCISSTGWVVYECDEDDII